MADLTPEELDELRERLEQTTPTIVWAKVRDTHHGKRRQTITEHGSIPAKPDWPDRLRRELLGGPGGAPPDDGAWGRLVAAIRETWTGDEPPTEALVAERMGIGDRQVRRIAKRGGGYRKALEAARRT